jgi:hypothetical protein
MFLAMFIGLSLYFFASPIAILIWNSPSSLLEEDSRVISSISYPALRTTFLI